jgi:hypothetical protein
VSSRQSFHTGRTVALSALFLKSSKLILLSELFARVQRARSIGQSLTFPREAAPYI